ncbi:hypothetical protein LXEBMM8_EKPBGFGD_01180 [Lactiplantibacillus xiangfangensis]
MPKLKYIILDLTIIFFIISLVFIWQVIVLGPLRHYAILPIIITGILFFYWLHLAFNDHKA